MGNIGFMLLGGIIAIDGLGVLVLIIMLGSWIEEKIIKYKIKKRYNLNNQLTQAKEIISEFVEWANWQGNSKCPSFKSIQDKAETFLKESES